MQLNTLILSSNQQSVRENTASSYNFLRNEYQDKSNNGSAIEEEEDDNIGEGQFNEQYNISASFQNE